MKKQMRCCTVFVLGLFLISSLVFIPSAADASGTLTYRPNEKTEGLVKNPGMGWVLYCDAFAQMTRTDMPDINKCVFDPELFWNTFDSSGATAKASIFYLRAPWSYFESSEGQYSWDHNGSYQALIQGALDRNLKLAFRVYIDSQDSWQQATPQYVRNAGAKGYNNTFWTPYINDAVFLNKLSTFIAAFGQQYNDPDTVDFIDGMGLGNWGEGHNMKTDLWQSRTLNSSIEFVTSAYEQAFPNVLLGGQQGGALDAITQTLVQTNKFDVLRRDSLGMPQYFKEADRAYYVKEMLTLGIPLFAENGWNYFSHNFTNYMNQNGKPFSNIRDMLVHSMNDALTARANTFDLRVPEDAIEWMNNVDLVDQFVVNGGYRFVPVSFSMPDTITSHDYISIQSNWKNTGVGILPNRRPGWDYKYKVAYALLDPVTSMPVQRVVTNIDPSEWLKGQLYSYQSQISFGQVAGGVYRLAYAIVDTTKGDTPAIELAVTDAKTAAGWYTMGSVQVSGIDSIAPKEALPSYRYAEDFGASQGEKQWYYMQGSGGSYSNMTWEAVNQRWKGSGAYNIANVNGLIHPDASDSIIAWKAPMNGQITIDGQVKKQNAACGDGVQVKMLHNSNQIWPTTGWQLIGASDYTGITHQLTASVSANDLIYFIVNKNGNANCDGTIWNPIIEYNNKEVPVNKAPLASISTTMGTSAGSVAHINNGVMTDAWSSANKPVFPGYITLDLGVQTVQTDRVTLVTHYAQGQGITNVDIEYFDGLSWLPLRTDVKLQWHANTNVPEYRDITFERIETNKIRLKINSGNLTWSHIALNELQWWTY